MKISKIADKIIVLLVERSVERDEDDCTLDHLCDVYPEFTRKQLILALSMLQDDGFIEVFWSDDEPSDFMVQISAIRKIQDDTLVKRGYRFAKEVRQWF